MQHYTGCSSGGLEGAACTWCSSSGAGRVHHAHGAAIVGAGRVQCSTLPGAVVGAGMVQCSAAAGAVVGDGRVQTGAVQRSPVLAELLPINR